MTETQINATAASLLGFLHDGPMTGWDLVQLARERIGDFWTLTQSQVYRELAAMADRGLVVAGERGRRDRRPYEITPAGREAFQGWLGRLPTEETIRVPLLLAISFGRHMAPGALAAVVREHRRVHAGRLATYLGQRAAIARHVPDPDPYRLASLAFGIAYEQAVVAWFDGLPAEIRGDVPWDDAAPGEPETEGEPA